MSFVKRIVLDTSTLISAALRPQSLPRQALVKALTSGVICVSPATLAELEHVLMRDKFDRYLDRESREKFISLYRKHGELFTVPEDEVNSLNPACRDPHDNKFLALALSCEADVLITSDDDLLVLHPYHGIPVQTPKDFLSAE